MDETVGTLLWEMRSARGWSQGELARRAGVSPAALSRWEAGARQPRVTELEAVLGALGATAGQRAAAFARVKAPRAVRHLRRALADSALGAPPTPGDLLRALRLRRGWTQEQAAAQLGVGRNTVARWEAAERLPAPAQVEALGRALGASAAEADALATGRLAAPASADPEAWWARVEAHRAAAATPTSPEYGTLDDLTWLALESEGWRLAARHASLRPRLAHVLAYHAMLLADRGRWAAATPRAARARALTPPEQGATPAGILGVLVAADIAVHAGPRPAPARGIALLRPWQDRGTDPAYAAWLLNNLAGYMVGAGHAEAGLGLARQACAVAARADNPDELYLRRWDLGRMLLRAGRPAEALRAWPGVDPDRPWDETSARLRLAQAHRQLGDRAEAAAHLQRALDLLGPDGGDATLRADAQALALLL